VAQSVEGEGAGRKLALVIGSAACVWNDIDAALDLATFDYTICTKDAGIHYPGHIDLWCSLHPERFRKTDCHAREMKGYPPARKLCGHKGGGGGPEVNYRTEHRFDGQKHAGSSGLFAVKCGMELLPASTRFVLAGVPMSTDMGHFYRERAWADGRNYLDGWREAMPHIKDRVRSMSGWTQTLLGRPTPDWLAS
jgi:hypothetical protein